jgi:hypothetical protein
LLTASSDLHGTLDHLAVAGPYVELLTPIRIPAVNLALAAFSPSLVGRFAHFEYVIVDIFSAISASPGIGDVGLWLGAYAGAMTIGTDYILFNNTAIGIRSTSQTTFQKAEAIVYYSTAHQRRHAHH